MCSDLHSLAVVDSGVKRGNLRRGDPFEYTLGCLEDGDVHAERTQRGRRFQPDVTAAHDHNPPTRCSGGTDQLDVCSGTQVVNSGKIHPWCGESSGPCAGAQRELGVRQRVAGAQRHTLGTPVDRLHGRIQESNVLLFVEISAANQEVVEAVLAGQVSLRQRRPVVGQSPLVADEHDLPRPPLPSKISCQLRAGVARADDHRSFGSHALGLGVRRTISLLIPLTKFDCTYSGSPTTSMFSKRGSNSSHRIRSCNSASRFPMHLCTPNPNEM
ncbi:Uncharacterised protein [Mycobacteroides abscessus subsp. abscessus]|uniref:Uncharacterized protein n=1 Tax=Mycobacteroides abscessus subsp. massiliense TaxID=1962118 RepID=A0A1T8SXY7_9MYCO|nr:Uncharacterised protein [Mycobacteroides abscessus subsp. abscessus]SIN31014.1 Uncharacterised protein [Mycobacteroides abscessus subsp. bolletii]SKM73135.1 Uncharacterised protein [Mycobacteroides abscessus subsp. massiliense]SHX56049.1 Uncharacterised protein [Mycobacteroides abscessus subsp. abscessus]SIC38911.1 Uncharacterised protein [Mycobacteroides abscessus subsp. abscessus]